MTETFVRVSDVADELVQSFLHRLTHRFAADYIKEAWYRVLPGSSATLPVEDGATIDIRPVFEVLVSVSEPVTGLSRALAEAASDMSGNLRLMADAVMDGQLTAIDLEQGSWRVAEVPRIPLPVNTQEALSV